MALDALARIAGPTPLVVKPCRSGRFWLSASVSPRFVASSRPARIVFMANASPVRRAAVAAGQPPAEVITADALRTETARRWSRRRGRCAGGTHTRGRWRPNHATVGTDPGRSRRRHRSRSGSPVLHNPPATVDADLDGRITAVWHLGWGDAGRSAVVVRALRALTRGGGDRRLGSARRRVRRSWRGRPIRLQRHRGSLAS